MKALFSHLFMGESHFSKEKGRFFEVVFCSYQKIFSIFESQKDWDSLESFDRLLLLFPIVRLPLEKGLTAVFSEERLLLWAEIAIPFYQRLFIALEKKEAMRLKIKCNTRLLRRWSAFHKLEHYLEQDLAKMLDLFGSSISGDEGKRSQLLRQVQHLFSPSTV